MCNQFQDHNLVAKFNRITRLNLHQGMQGILTETANGSVTGFVAIPSVIFFLVFILQHALSYNAGVTKCPLIYQHLYRQITKLMLKAIVSL